MDFYVSQNGIPGNEVSCSPGTAEAPFSSLPEARDAVRALIRNGLTEPVTVHVTGANTALPV